MQILSLKIFPLVQYLRIQRILNHQCLASSPKRTPKLILTSTLTTKRTRRGNDQTFSKICYFTQLGESASIFQPTPRFCPNRLVPLGKGYPPPLGVCPLLDQISSIQRTNLVLIRWGLATPNHFFSVKFFWFSFGSNNSTQKKK